MILRDARRFGKFGRCHAIWVIVLMVSVASVSVFVAGCKQNKTGSVLDGTPAGSGEATAKKPLPELTAMEVAQNPAAYGFQKSGGFETRPIHGMEGLGSAPSKDEQWAKETSDGKLRILSIHYDKDGKIVNAKWGGFGY